VAGAKVIITFEGLDQVIANLTEIETKGEENLVKLTKALAADTEQAWQDVTHRRSGRLQGADVAEAMALSFTLKNVTYYYDWVNDGHWTPRGWRTKRGYRLAKRRSHVEGQEMTQKAMMFVSQNILEYLSKFLNGV
jgi:hypothetical protein